MACVGAIAKARCPHSRHQHQQLGHAGLFKVFKLEKLLSIEDRGQWDRVTALRRPYAPDIDLWPWPMTMTFNLRQAMVITHARACTQTQVQRSVSSKDKSGNKRTDRRTIQVALSSRLTRSETRQQGIADFAAVAYAYSELFVDKCKFYPTHRHAPLREKLPTFVCVPVFPHSISKRCS